MFVIFIVRLATYLKFYGGIPDCQIDIYDTKSVAAIILNYQHVC